MIKYFNIRLLIIIAAAICYIILSNIVSEGLFNQTQLAYYNYLLSAFFHGRLELTPFLNTTDLSWYGGKWYMYWGPSPVLFILPFYLFSRTGTSDVFYTLVAGILNILLFYFVINEAAKKFAIHLSNFSYIFLILSFAFLTPNLYLSLDGRIWHTNQVIAITYLLGFFLFYFKFLNQPKRFIYFLCSVVLLNLAVLSRYTLVFHFLLFLPLLPWFNKDKVESKKLALFLVLISTFFALLTLTYNYLRFNDIFETGFTLTNARDRYMKDIQKGQILSFDNFPHNFDTYVGHPVILKLEQPFVEIHKEGNSALSLYPLLFFAPVLFLKKHLNNRNYGVFLRWGLLVVFLQIMFLLLYLATGWAQFGTRYLLDVLPLFYILLIFVTNFIPRVLKTAVLFYGIFVNISGSLVFYWLK